MILLLSAKCILICIPCVVDLDLPPPTTVYTILFAVVELELLFALLINYIVLLAIAVVVAVVFMLFNLLPLGILAALFLSLISSFSIFLSKRDWAVFAAEFLLRTFLMPLYFALIYEPLPLEDET